MKLLFKKIFILLTASFIIISFPGCDLFYATLFPPYLIKANACIDLAGHFNDPYGDYRLFTLLHNTTEYTFILNDRPGNKKVIILDSELHIMQTYRSEFLSRVHSSLTGGDILIGCLLWNPDAKDTFTVAGYLDPKNGFFIECGDYYVLSTRPENNFTMLHFDQYDSLFYNVGSPTPVMISAGSESFIIGYAEIIYTEEQSVMIVFINKYTKDGYVVKIPLTLFPPASSPLIGNTNFPFFPLGKIMKGFVYPVKDGIIVRTKENGLIYYNYEGKSEKRNILINKFKPGCLAFSRTKSSIFYFFDPDSGRLYTCKY